MKMAYIKNILLLVICTLGVTSAYSQATFRTCCYYNGYWGEWKDTWVRCWGNYSGFILYSSGDHKSDYYFRFQIDDYTEPSKKEIKKHRKTDTWWTYTGTVEYYISDVYPTFKSCLMDLGHPLTKKDTEDSYYTNKKLPLARAANMRNSGKTIGFTRVTSRATIKIAPYKKHPNTYNIWIDDVGFGISLNGNSFNLK